jgi:hypothetical protein
MAAIGNIRVFNLRGQLPGAGISSALNLVVGTIPAAFGSLANLVCLEDVDGTLVTGTIPEGLCNNKVIDIFLIVLVGRSTYRYASVVVVIAVTLALFISERLDSSLD